MVIDLGTDGEDRILQVRWADGSVDSVRPDELRLQEAVTMSTVRKLIEAVVQGHNPRAVVESVLEGYFKPGDRVSVDLNLARKEMPAQQFALLQKDLKAGGGHLKVVKVSDNSVSVVAWGANPARMMMGPLQVKAAILSHAPMAEGFHEDIGPDPVPTGPMVGTHPAADVPPMPEDPCFMYRTSFDSGGDGPHAHIAMLDDTGNGTTDEEMGSQHSVLRFEVQPDPKDGHVHTLDQGTRRDVPSSQNGEGFSFHLLQTDPNRFSY